MRRCCLVLACLLLSACVWKSYGQIMRVHVDVLAGLADKIVVKSEAGGRPTPNDLTELIYPLQRGRQFATQYQSRADHESYRRFVALLDGYQQFVDAIDAARGDDARWQAARADLPAKLEQLRAAADAVRTALTAEGY